MSISLCNVSECIQQLLLLLVAYLMVLEHWFGSEFKVSITMDRDLRNAPRALVLLAHFRATAAVTCKLAIHTVGHVFLQILDVAYGAIRFIGNIIFVGGVGFITRCTGGAGSVCKVHYI